MGILSNLDTDNLEQTEDKVTGTSTGSFVVDSDIYLATIKRAYLVQSQSSKAQAMSLILTLPDDKEHRETIYFSSKEGLPYKLSDNGARKPLLGFNTINDLCMLTTEVPLKDQVTEEKKIAIWDNNAKEEVPQFVNVFTDLEGKQVNVALLKVIANKRKKEGNEYVNSEEKTTFNRIDKFMHYEQKVTLSEAIKGKDAKFYDEWLKEWKGKDKDEYKAVTSSGTRPTASSTPTTRKAGTSLFNKN